MRLDAIIVVMRRGKTRRTFKELSEALGESTRDIASRAEWWFESLAGLDDCRASHTADEIYIPRPVSNDHILAHICRGD